MIIAQLDDDISVLQHTQRALRQLKSLKSDQDAEPSTSSSKELQKLEQVSETILTAQSVEEFWNKIRSENGENTVIPSLILLDISLNADLTDRAGLELLEQIRSEPDLVHTPVIMLSQWNDPELINKSFEEGANSYVQKGGARYSDKVAKILEFWLKTGELPTINE